MRGWCVPPTVRGFSLSEPINGTVASLFPHPTMSKFPEVQGGGSLILAWQIKNKHVLVVGGGEVRGQT